MNMKNGIRAKFPFLILFVILFFAALFSVTFYFTVHSSEAATDEYQITSYNVHALVNEDNSSDITETISVHFDVNSHGIYRYIPTIGSARFVENGKKYSIRYMLDIDYTSCSHNIRFDSDSNNTIFIIGSSHHYANEYEKYVLSYSVRATGDNIPSFDQFYYNFIGDAWDTTIDNFSVDIDFAKPVETQNFYFYVEDQEFSCPVIDNSVHFEYANTIPPFHALTGRITLQDGYFTSSLQYSNTTYDLIVPIVLCAVGLVAGGVAIIVLFVKNNKKKILPIVEFSDIEGITPVDAGYIIDRETQTGEMSALIVYWAGKGYLSIDEKDGAVTLHKLKPADDKMKAYEKSIFNAMFKESDSYNISQDNTQVAIAVNGAKNAVKTENEKYFSKTISSLKYLFAFLFSVLIGLNIYFSAQVVRPTPFGWVECVFLSAISFLSLTMILYAKDRKITMPKATFFASIIIGSIFALSTFIVPIVFLFDAVAISPISIIVTPIVSALMILASLMFNDRIEGENKEVGRIFGLRKFILLTEKDRIKVLAEENPEMFYNILPYAYVLGVSGVWIEKFKDIEIPSPVWYTTNATDAFLHIYIANRIMFTFNSFNLSVMRALPKSSPRIGGGGGFGGGFGGGHVGGGFGGGGGGRW